MTTITVGRNQTDIQPIVQTTITYRSVEVSSSPSSEQLQDVYDVATALKTQALYRERGLTAFIPLEHYRERRKQG